MDKNPTLQTTTEVEIKATSLESLRSWAKGVYLTQTGYLFLVGIFYAALYISPFTIGGASSSNGIWSFLLVIMVALLGIAALVRGAISVSHKQRIPLAVSVIEALVVVMALIGCADAISAGIAGWLEFIFYASLTLMAGFGAYVPFKLNNKLN